MPEEDSLHQYVRAWENARAFGRDLTPEQLCPEKPELWPSLTNRLKQLRSSSQPALSILPPIPHHPIATQAQLEIEDETSGPPEPSLRSELTQPSNEYPRQIAGYRMVSLIGKGGMGAVFLAEDVKLGRRVAVKLILPGWAEHPKPRARFLREAKSQASIEHDNIVPIYHFGEEKGWLYVVMPLLKGENLRSKLQRDKDIPLSTVLRISRDLAEGLAGAHEHGVIHRDMKPGNIWLDGDLHSSDPRQQFRRARILDFGLARSFDSEDSQVTGTGEVLGTPSYMSPEQAAGEKVDHRTDIFALGVLMYEMVTGKRPFEGPTAVATILNIATVIPPPADSVNPDVPPFVATLIARMMAKNMYERPASAREVADEIQQLQEMLGTLKKKSTTNDDSRTEEIEDDYVPPPPSMVEYNPDLSSDGGRNRSTSGVRRDPQVEIDTRGDTHPRKPVSQPDDPQFEIEPVEDIHPEKTSVRLGIYASIAGGIAVVTVVLFIIFSKNPSGSNGSSIVKKDPPEKSAPTQPSPEPDPLPEVTIRVNVKGAEVQSVGEKVVKAVPGANEGEFVFRPAPAKSFAISIRKNGYTPAGLTIDTGKTTAYSVQLLPTTMRVLLRPFPLGASVLFMDDPNSKPSANRQGEFVVARKPQSARVSLPGFRDATVRVPLPPEGKDEVRVNIVFSPLEEITNSLGIRMRLIPPGVFRMAGTSGAPDRMVSLTQPFYLSRTELTRKQFQAFVSAIGYKTEAERSKVGGEGYAPGEKQIFQSNPRFSWKDTGYEQEDDHPVVNVSWNDAKAFCDWLSKIEGKKYRLPTEAQWDYASRAGADDLLPFPEAAREVIKSANVADAALIRRLKKDNPMVAFGSLKFFAADVDDSYAFTAPVGSFLPNRFELVDTVGNVLEWCEDWAGSNADLPDRDPIQTKPHPMGHRIARGGGFLLSHSISALTGRVPYAPDTASFQLGFRLKMEVELPTAED